MEIKSFGFSDTGRVRKSNEDSYLCKPEERLFLVADGMGGQTSGDIASRLAVEYVEKFIVRSRSRDIQWPVKESGNFTPEQRRFLSAINFANRRIFHLSGKNPDMKGMGTTLAGVLMEGERFVVANVGDSRVYKIGGGQIRRITQDHSLAAEQVRSGKLTEEEARIHSHRNILTRALGVHQRVRVDLFLTDIVHGDMILLCTDGLYHMLDDTKILSIIGRNKNKSLQERARSLVLEANLAGGTDNITVILLALRDRPR